MKCKTPIIAFDLDDTLYDERSYVRECLTKVALECEQRFGVDHNTTFEAMFAGPNPYIRLCETKVADQLSLEEFLKIYRSTYPTSLPLRKDAEELLQWIKLEHPEIPLYLITDGSSDRQRAKMQALGIFKYFDDKNILISEETGFEKYTLMPFIKAMVQENRNDGWIYIGDNPVKDFYWPNRLGWQTFMVVDRGLNTHRQNIDNLPTPEYRAGRNISLLTDIIPLIQ